MINNITGNRTRLKREIREIRDKMSERSEYQELFLLITVHLWGFVGTFDMSVQAKTFNSILILENKSSFSIVGFTSKYFLANTDLWQSINKPKGLKVTKEDQKAYRHDGRQAERSRERQRGFDIRWTFAILESLLRLKISNPCFI